MNNRTVSAQEFVRAWTTKHGYSGKVDASAASTIDHKVIVTILGFSDWLELSGDNPDQPISKTKREQIGDWLRASCSKATLLPA